MNIPDYMMFITMVISYSQRVFRIASSCNETHLCTVYPNLNPCWLLASAAATPFAPFATSAANTAALEAKYLSSAIKDRRLRRPHAMHLAAGAAGLAIFALDEIRPFIPYVHSTWHLLSCVAVQRTLPLLQHVNGSNANTV
jgi:hypothetical protein